MTATVCKPPKSPATRRALMDLAMKAAQPSERDIENTCTDFLYLDNWRCIKTDLPHLRGLGVSEKGMADRLYLRYWIGTVNQLSLKPPYESWTQVLWIEWKKRGGKAKAHQRAWIGTERARGALVWLAGEDFPASIEGFQQFYRASGLMRRKI